MFAPKGANVNFLEKRGPKKIALRTYERGVEDETLACGTGVVASALVFAATENVSGTIGVLVRGGNELMVGFDRSGGQFRNVTLTGPAEFVFEGTIELYPPPCGRPGSCSRLAASRRFRRLASAARITT